MPSQGVLVRQRVGEAILATARTHAHLVGEHLQTRLAAVVQVGESDPRPVELSDCIGIQLQLARHLETRLDALRDADLEQRAERSVAPDARERRDRLARELYVSLRDLRAGFAGVFGGAEGGRLLGLRGSTARRPQALLCQARRVVESLRRPEVDPESGPLARLAGRFPGFEVECARVADRLETEIEAVQGAMAEVERAVEQWRRIGAVRSRALEAFDRAVRGIGRLLQGFYILAGSPELARRVRFNVQVKDLAAKGGA